MSTGLLKHIKYGIKHLGKFVCAGFVFVLFPSGRFLHVFIIFLSIQSLSKALLIYSARKGTGSLVASI